MVNPSPSHILIIEDDAKVRLLLRRCFESEGFRVSEAGSGVEAIKRVDAATFDLVTLDLQLPDGDGFAVGREIRARSAVPIIMVTGKGDTIDRVVGLELGADDYITKPFQLREVVARIRAVLRRTAAGGLRAAAAGAAGGDAILAFEGWVLDVPKRELRSGAGAICDLTTSEFDLLKVFATHANRALSRDQIMDLLRGHDWTPTDRSIDNLVMRLRRKIEPDVEHPRLIKSVRGVGYCLAATVSSP
ncbi:MAG TPA: response regulator transcription factor [Hyphomicrobiaceae bacterium]|nr:response regulator transcription factor [Hyphomicrobiaceae bacterium]